jgi:Secretion system C-terminal sorting domain
MKIKQLLIAALLLFYISNENNAKACIDTTSVIWVDCDYDSGFNEVLLRVNNMQLFGSPAGAFCTCGITSLTNVFSNILYVSFVDDQTFTPIAGFVPWTASTAAATEWDGVQSGNWDGFLAQTIGSGLNTGDPVDLIIRATLPAGYTFTFLDSNLVISYLGTDEWDNSGSQLAFSHNNVVSLVSGGAIAYTVQPLNYFSNIDNQILTAGIEDLSLGLKIFPNPAVDVITIDGLTQSARVIVYDNVGRIVSETITTKEFGVQDLAVGIYYTSIQIDGLGKQVLKFEKK